MQEAIDEYEDLKIGENKKIKEINLIINDVKETLKVRFASVIFAGESEISVEAITLKTDVKKIKRDYSLLENEILNDGPVMISDAKNDKRYSDNPFVNHLDFTFFANEPIISSCGKNLGKLMVVCGEKRNFSAYENMILELSAKKIADILEKNTEKNKCKKVKEFKFIYPVKDVSFVSTFSEENIGFGEQKTRGLRELYNHPEIQSVIPFDEETTFSIFRTITNQIKNGLVIEENISYRGIVEDCDVQFKKIKKGNNEVFRIIYPDGNGIFPSDENCDADFKNQYYI